MTKKQICTYIIGLLVMAFGIVLIKKADIGMSPISTIPNALSNITPLTLGRAVILFQCACIAAIMILLRKLNLRIILIFPVAVGFGFLIDFYMFVLPTGFSQPAVRILLCLAGIILTALGIVLIRMSGLILPAPDELMVVLSAKLNRKLPMVKTIGDICWVGVSFVIEFPIMHRILSIGPGTLASMLLTGFFVGRISKWIGQMGRE